MQTILPRKPRFVGFFLCMVALALFYTPTTFAQSENNTVPPGTIPNGIIYMPFVAKEASAPIPATFSSIPIEGSPVDRLAAINGDLNLSLRSYTATTGSLSLIDIDGPTDPDAPQLATIVSPARVLTFTAVYQVYDWDWSCGEHGCQGDPIGDPPVTMLEMQTTIGDAIHIPSRNQQVYAGGFKAMVLYAEETRITLGYTRRDTPAIGYVVHLEELTVDPALLALYRQLDAAGRKSLPALRNGERLGNARGTTIKVAVRDTGSFMDPRARKDWWVGY